MIAEATKETAADTNGRRFTPCPSSRFSLHALPAGPASSDDPSDGGATRTSASARVTHAGAAPRSAAHALAFETVYAENFAFAWRSLRRLGVAEDARR